MTGVYTGWDGDAKGKRAGTEKLVQLLVQRYGFRNLGTWGVRPMRGSSRPSVHGTGRADRDGDGIPDDQETDQ